VRDIQVDEGIEVLTEAGHVVIKVMEARVEEVVEEVEAEAEVEAEGTAESPSFKSPPTLGDIGGCLRVFQ